MRRFLMIKGACMLGVKRYHVALVPHNEEWTNQYQITKNELLPILGNNIIGMQSIGYDWCGDRDVPNRYLFVKRKHGDISTHHIHCYPRGSEGLKDTILFCEYLNNHAEYAKYYNDLKEELAAKYSNDRSAYTATKSDFINNIISLAREGQCGE